MVALDDPESNKFIAETVKEHYPKVKIFVRAKNRLDAYHYINHGIDNVYRETLGTAVDMATDVIHETGIRKYAAARLGKRFINIDKTSLRKIAKKYEEGGDLFFSTRESIQREEALLSLDNLNFDTHDWNDQDQEENENLP